MTLTCASYVYEAMNLSREWNGPRPRVPIAVSAAAATAAQKRRELLTPARTRQTIEGLDLRAVKAARRCGRTLEGTNEFEPPAGTGSS